MNSSSSWQGERLLNGKLSEEAIYIYMQAGFFNSGYRGDRSMSINAPVGHNQTGKDFIESMSIPQNYADDYKSLILQGDGGKKWVMTSTPAFYDRGTKFDSSKLEQDDYQYARKKGGPGRGNCMKLPSPTCGRLP